MEVHHHGHAHGKKGLKEYFFEFFMLFLAVFCGFMAEYFLEHKIEHDREKQFMRTMLRDLEKDSMNIRSTVDNNLRLRKGLDTLLELLAHPSKEERYKKDVLIYSMKYAFWYFPVEFSKITINQLNNSGGYRLIRDQAVSAGIADYQQGMETCNYQFDELEKYFHVYEASQKKVLYMPQTKKIVEYMTEDDLHMFASNETIDQLVPPGPWLLPDGYENIHQYYGDILFFYAIVANSMRFTEMQYQRSIKLAELIRENYHL